jgi:GNAT superfamily N-acetyltransferase
MNKETVEGAKQRLFDLAMKDPFLGPESLKAGLDGMELIFLPTGETIGFIMPMKGDGGYYRVGSIYIDPKHRGKRYAAQFIRQYFSNKAGQAWIRPENKPSQTAFLTSGFYKSGRKTTANGKVYEEWLNRPRTMGW